MVAVRITNINHVYLDKKHFNADSIQSEDSFEGAPIVFHQFLLIVR